MGLKIKGKKKRCVHPNQRNHLYGKKPYILLIGALVQGTTNYIRVVEERYVEALRRYVVHLIACLKKYSQSV